MISVPGREVLQAMKRVDIQKLCKEYGVRANLKTEALIDLLLDASQPQPSRSTLPQPPQRSTSVRMIIQPGVRPRGRSSGSVIIHDTDEEEEGEEAIGEIEVEQQPKEHKPPPAPVDPTPRTRKAKDTQYRLGVGRPIIAGGSGARSVTKSVSVSRGSKRAKSIKIIKPSEDSIAEEPEPESIPTVTSSEQTGPSDSLQVPQPHSIPLQTHTAGLVEPLSLQIVENAVAAALAPVQKELEDQKAQLSELRDKVSGIIETFETRIWSLAAEIERLRAQAPGHCAVEIQRPKETPQRIPNPPSTPKRVRSPVDPLGDALPESSATSSDSPNPNGLLSHQERETDKPNQGGSLLPGFHTVLGKRPRDSTASTTTAFFELGQEEELSEIEITKRIARPAQKRAKLSSSAITEDADDCSGPLTGAQGSQDPGPSQPSARPGFPIFGDPDYVEMPPPTDSLLDFFAPPSPPFMSVPTAVGAPADAFRFGCLPTSTPARFTFPAAMGTFPHPEPPTSPSPANNVDRPRSRQSERLGIFGHRRGSSGTTGRSGSGGPTGGQESGINPSMWAGGMQRQPSSNEVASGLGLTVLRTAATEEGTPVPPARRTMYGTELEGDTRFGDFGVEGVATGFWAGGRR